MWWLLGFCMYIYIINLSFFNPNRYFDHYFTRVLLELLKVCMQFPQEF